MRALRRSLLFVAILALPGVPGAIGGVAAGDGDEPVASTPGVGPGVVWGPEAHEAFDSLAQSGVVRFTDFEDIPTGLHRRLRLEGPDGSISVGLRTTKLRWPPPPRGAPSRAPVAMLPYDFVKEPAVHRLMGVTKTKGGKGQSRFVPDGQSRFELVLDPPVSHVGFMRPWNTWSVTRFYDAGGGLLANHRNTVDHEFVGYVADTPEDEVRRIVFDGVPSQPDDEYNKLYMAGTLEDLYLSGGRPEVDDAQSPIDPSTADHPDDLVIEAPGSALDDLADPDAGEAADDGAADEDSDQADTMAGASEPDAASDGLDVNELVRIVKLITTDQSISRDQLRFLLKANIEQTGNAEAAYTAMVLYELLFSDDGAEVPAADGSADEATPEAPASKLDPPGQPEADSLGEPEAHTPGSAAEPVLLPADPSIGVTDVGSPFGYDAYEGLSDGVSEPSDTPSDAVTTTRPQDPPPKMKPKHAQAGRAWVSLDADHEVRKIVPKVDPKTKKQTGWKTRGRVTLHTGTWYQMKENRNKALIFYDTTGSPVGAAGKNEKRGLQTETWDRPGAESP